MIYVECYPDTVLVRTLTGLPRREVIHERKGKGRVVDQVRRGSQRVGLLDEDPGATQPRRLEEMVTVENLEASALWVRQDSAGNRIVILRPRLEEWILRAARQAGIDLDDYNLPTDAGQLHRVINDRLPSFQRLVEALNNTPRLRALAGLLSG